MSEIVPEEKTAVKELFSGFLSSTSNATAQPALDVGPRKKFSFVPVSCSLCRRSLRLWCAPQGIFCAGPGSPGVVGRGFTRSVIRGGA